jgi:DNA-directed RNA polymerase subunit RPC12/RpoP
MDPDSTRDLLVRGLAAAKAGQKDEARFYLEWILRLGPSEDVQTEAWWWLSRVARNPDEERRCLEEVLARQPAHPQARRARAVLDGRLAPSAVIDPDRLPAAAEASPPGAERFTCPRCGGRLASSGDARWLGCAYCGWRRSIETGEAAPEQDFVVAMATARGHRRPQQTRRLDCRGCGAPYMLAPETISLTCPYCASTHVVENAASEELVPPDGLLPFAIDASQAAAAGQAARAVRSWLGLYLPLWSFGLSGEVPWRGVREDRRGNRETVAGSQLVLETDYLVPATRRLPQEWARPALLYPTAELRPFRAEALADWPAETYQIPMSDAAVSAHAEVFSAVRERARQEIPAEVRELHFDSTLFTFDVFRLILAPAWIGLDGGASPRPIAVVNGQTGLTAVASDR